MNFLLGVSENKNKKIKDNNLLNFYLSSVTFPDFKYEPNNKTNKSIWEYMNSANLITIDDITDIDGLDAEKAGELIMTARAPWFAETAGEQE